MKLCKNKLMATIIATMGLLPSTGMAIDVEANPYVRLYRKQLQAADAAAASQSAIVANSRIRAERYDYLYESGAVTDLERDIQRNEYELSKVDLEIAQAKVKQAKAFYQVAKARIGEGLDMPVCFVED